MEDKLLDIKAAFVATLAAIGAVLGWKGLLALAWVLAMGLDWLSGSMAACKAGEWERGKAHQGAWHKAAMLVVVIVATLADMLIGTAIDNIPGLNIPWPGALLPLVLVWYTVTELGSTLENAVKMGAKVPAWLTKFLKVSVKVIDNAAPQIPNPTPEKVNEDPPVDVDDAHGDPPDQPPEEDTTE